MQGYKSVASVAQACANLLESKARTRLLLLGALQVFVAVLDLLGLLLVGTLTALFATGTLPAPMESLFPGLSLEDLQGTIIAVGALLVCLLLVVKSLSSAILARRILKLLANGQAQVATRLARDVLDADLVIAMRRPSQELAYILTSGAYSAVLVVLGQTVVLISEMTLILMLAAALLVLNPFIAVLAIAYFLVIAAISHRIFSSWALEIGEVAKQSEIKSIKTVQEAVRGFREIRVANRMSFFEKRFSDQRTVSSKVQADLAFLAVLPKYIFEVALIAGAALLGAFEFWRNPGPTAIGTIAIFLIAGSRIVPSLLRLQGATILLKSAAGPAREVIVLDSELSQVGKDHNPENEHSPRSSPRTQIRVENLSFRYPGASTAVFRDLSFSIHEASLFAIVGPSGGGKSTLLDLLAGLHIPNSGKVLIDGMSSRDLITSRPNFIAYVPQSPLMIDGTIRENVALGIRAAAIDDEAVVRALEDAHLWDLVVSLGGLDFQVGEGGGKLSGGQRQRLGLARALYGQPRLLLLDEATSSLDAESEAVIGETVLKISRTSTVIVVAHRLSTARVADRVAYVDEGSIVIASSFDELRERVPKFDLQASLSTTQDPP